MFVWLVGWSSIALSGTCDSYDDAQFLLDTQDLDSTESSGLAASRTRPGVFFTHDDSGAAPHLYSFSLDGSLAETHIITDAAARDWEDMAAAPCPTAIQRREQIEHCLYIGDIGDNPRNRSDIQVYVIGEPAKGETKQALETWSLVYPAGPQDAEALLIHPGTQQITIVTKSTSGEVGVYTASPPINDDPVVLTHEASLSLEDGNALGSMVTGGDWDMDGERLILRTYTTLYLWETDPCEADAHWSEPPIRMQTTWEWQGEAICFDLEGGILTSSEGSPMAVSGIECLDWIEGDGPCSPETIEPDTGDWGDSGAIADTGCPDEERPSSESGPSFHQTHQNDSCTCGKASSRGLMALFLGLGLHRRRRSTLPRAPTPN